MKALKVPQLYKEFSVSKKNKTKSVEDARNFKSKRLQCYMAVAACMLWFTAFMAGVVP